MNIYVYSENTTRKGTIFRGEDCQAEENGDVFLWGSGTAETLIAEALESLARPCGMAPQFRHRCDRAVLEYLDGPEVESHYDRERGSYWLPAVESAEEVEN